jgi:hypothetical protein
MKINYLQVFSLLLIGLGTILFAMATLFLTNEIDDKEEAADNISGRNIEATNLAAPALESINASRNTSTDMEILRLLGTNEEILDGKLRREEDESSVR